MGPQKTIVCDTNILVSALGWRGLEHRLYRHCRQQDLQLAISLDLLDELKRVLAYPKLNFTRAEIDQYVSDILNHAMVVVPSERLDVIEDDPDDDRVLECAVTTKAAWIVSGDKHLHTLGQYEGIPVVSAKQVLEELGLL